MKVLLSAVFVVLAYRIVSRHRRDSTGNSVPEGSAQLDPAVRPRSEPDIHPEVSKISGLIPPELDARAEYRAHLLNKHS